MDSQELDFEVNAAIIAVIKEHRANTATMAREIVTLRAELAQSREDRQLAELAMRAAYAAMLQYCHHQYGVIQLVDLKAAMQALETALRMPVGYWPR